MGALRILYSRRKTKGLFFSIRDLCFGRLSCSKYLLGTTANNLLCCWNLLTCSCKAAYTQYISCANLQLCALINLLMCPDILNHIFFFPCLLSSVSCPVWQWSGAPVWKPACCWLTPSLRTWLPSAIRLDSLTVSFKLGAYIWASKLASHIKPHFCKSNLNPQCRTLHISVFKSCTNW